MSSRSESAPDVGKLARAQVESLRDSRVRLRVDNIGDMRVRGDEDWLGRAIGNLVDNALFHSPADEKVELEIRRAADGVVVSVENLGTIPDHLKSRLFRRFVTTRSDKGGTGLGLAIVRAVAEAHGGRAELAEPGPPRVVFRVVLPPARS